LFKKTCTWDNIKTPSITDYGASITNREFGIFQTIRLMIINDERYYVKPKSELP